MLLGISSTLFAKNSSLHLIYGSDDRAEIDSIFDERFIEKSQSVAIKIANNRLMPDRDNPDKILFPHVSLHGRMPQLCESERFLNQTSLGSCSGFLVGPKTLVTAGHCALDIKDCNDNKWVFGFKENTTDFFSSQVYSCKKIISQRFVYDSKEVSDYAVIELDRNVENYTPLRLRKFGRVLLNTALLVIGHPMGLPMKFSDGAVVKRMNDNERKTPFHSFFLRTNYFTANLDVYAGNSGSPVFNKKTGEVEGILVQGAEDFIYNPNKECVESRHLSNNHHEVFEKVMRINKVPGLP